MAEQCGVCTAGCLGWLSLGILPAPMPCSLTNALLSLIRGGPNATILQLEAEVKLSQDCCCACRLSSAALTAILPTLQTFGAVGAALNPDLAALVANPTPGDSFLYPASA